MMSHYAYAFVVSSLLTPHFTTFVTTDGYDEISATKKQPTQRMPRDAAVYQASRHLIMADSFQSPPL